MAGHEWGSRVVSDSLHDACNADFPFWKRALAESGPSKSPDFNQGCCCQKLSFACFFGSVMLIEFGRVAGVCWGWCDAAALARAGVTQQAQPQCKHKDSCSTRNIGLRTVPASSTASNVSTRSHAQHGIKSCARLKGIDTCPTY